MACVNATEVKIPKPTTTAMTMNRTFFTAIRVAAAVLTMLLWLPLSGAAHAKRVALLIGNASYSVGALVNPPNDVAEMERALRNLGFQVQKVVNANQNQMKRAVRDFGTAAQGAELAILYYSGHGTQVNGENYLLPIGAPIDKESDYAIEAVAANDVLQQIRGASPKAAILILDACRDNPLAATTKSGTRGLSRMNPSTGTMVAFATAPNDTASDNGNYARVLAREMQKPGLEIMDVFRNTAAEVRRLSPKDKPQDPRISEVSINERVYLVSAPQLPVSEALLDPDEAAYKAALRANARAAYDAYLNAYPSGRYAGAVRVALAGSGAAPQVSATSTAVSAAQVKPHPPESTLLDNRYEILADGVEVRDARTKLIWQRCVVGQRWDGATCAGDAKQFDFTGAQRLASNGWRVPTIRELASLIFCSRGAKESVDLGDSEESSVPSLCSDGSLVPTLNLRAFPSTPAGTFWSSTGQTSARVGRIVQDNGRFSVQEGRKYGWFAGFTSGIVSENHLQDTQNLVRLVRGGM